LSIYGDGAALLSEPDLADCECLVIDQSMPGISGLETVRQLRMRHVSVPVILITGHVTGVLSASANRFGMNIVEKPLFGNSLVEGIRAMIKH